MFIVYQFKTRVVSIPRHGHRSVSRGYVISQYFTLKADADAYVAKQAKPDTYVVQPAGDSFPRVAA